MKFIAKPKLLTFAGATLILSLLFLAGGMVGPKKALAFSTTTPIQQSAPAINSANVNGSGTNTQPWFSVGRGQYDGDNSNAKVYVPNGASANLTIVHGGGYLCTGAGGINMDIWTNGGTPQVVYELDAMDGSEGLSAVSWQVTRNNQASGSACSDIVINIPSKVGVSSTHPGHRGYRVFYFTAHMINACNIENTCNTEKSYRLSTSTGYVGLSRNVFNNGNFTINDDTVFGIYMKDAPGKNGGAADTTWDYAAQFAPFCDEPASSESMGIYDIDYKYFTDPTAYPDYVKQDQGLSALIDKDNRSSGVYNWSLAPSAAYPSQRTAGGGGWNSVLGQDHSTTFLGFQYNNSQRYLMEFRDLSYRNVVQVRLPFDQFDSLPSVGSACSQTYSYSCRATGIPAVLTPGQTAQVTYTIKNTSSDTDWLVSDNPPEQYHRRVTVDGNQTANNFTTIPNNVPAGGSFQLTVNETVPAAGSTKIIFYEMWISTKGAMSGTPCNVVLSANNTPNGGISTDCSQTLVWGLTSTATYTHVTTVWDPAPPGWWTNVPPAQQGNYPYPPGPPVVSLLSYPGPVYWYQPPPSQTTVTTILPATIIPIKIHFQGSDGSSNDFYDNLNNPSGTVFYDTFNRFSFLKPHVSYTATLFAQTSGYIGPEQQGPYDYSQQIAQTSLGQCMRATCQGGSSVNMQVGQNGTVSYTINVTNDTNKTFDTSFGYQMKVNLSGGLAPAGPTTTSVSIPPGTNAVTGSFNVVSNSAGSFSIEFQYLGVDLTNVLPPSASCGAVDTTAYTLPYFQAWYGDVSAGGGFASPSGSPAINLLGSCGTAGDPPYVSPAASGDPNSGGIRAFGKLNNNRGSRTDFGAIAMGRIPGSAAGDIGFFSADNVSGSRPVFANTTGNMGGFLNGNAPTSGCTKDFFTDTQLSPSNSSGNLQSDIDACTDRCQYISNSSSYSISTINFPAGKQVTLYVDGDVTIDGNINYAKSFDPTNPANIPYLAIVAKGNIVVTGNVTLLNGLYIAQPTGNSKGIFATCDDVCTSQLVVNGAVIAQHVELLRTHGTLNAPSPDPNGVGGNPAEVFNFVPSMIIGVPAFATQFGTLEGLFSLSPVF